MARNVKKPPMPAGGGKKQDMREAMKKTIKKYAPAGKSKDTALKSRMRKRAPGR